MKKNIFFSIVLLTLFSFLNGCSKEARIETQTIVWDKNQLTVELSSEKVQVGELLFLYFKGKLEPDCSFQILHQKGIPITSQFLHFSFQDIEERLAVGEILWLEAGEKKIDNLMVEFRYSNGKSSSFQLDPIAVEVYSTITISEKEFPQSLVSLLAYFPTLNRPISFVYNHQKELLLFGVFAVVLILLFSALFGFFFYRKHQSDLHKRDYILQCEAIQSQLNENPHSKENLLVAYNLLIEGKQKLRSKKIRLSQSFHPFYQSMISSLEKALFSKPLPPEKGTMNELVTQWTIWTQQYKKMESLLSNSKKEDS